MIDEIIVRHSDEIIMIFHKEDLLQLPPEVLNRGIQRGQKMKEKLAMDYIKNNFTLEEKK